MRTIYVLVSSILYYLYVNRTHLNTTNRPTLHSFQHIPLPLPLKSVLIERTNRSPNAYYSRTIQFYFVLLIC